jgi:transcriptional regulator
MYIPRINRETDLDALTALMRRYPFATLITVHDGEPLTTPLPVVIECDGDEVTLQAHMARANEQWRGFGDGRRAQFLFQGPHAYISPSLYDGEQNVPTWNYALVIAHGVPEIITEEAAVIAAMEDLIERVEPEYQQQWQGLSERYKKGMLGGIVAFRMRVDRFEGKFKLSQNKTEEERRRVREWLQGDTGEMMK